MPGKKKVGGVKRVAPKGGKKKVGGVKPPDPSRVVTAECGCKMRYPSHVGRLPTGTPELLAPCSSHREPPEPRHPALQVGKTLGSTKPPVVSGTSIGHRACDLCEGEIVQGHWIHDKGCRGTVMLWHFLGAKKADWRCPYRCEPHHMPSGYTHHWRCQFWTETDETPFDSRYLARRELQEDPSTESVSTESQGE